MKINNPEVTLSDEARNSVKEEVRSGFLDWLYHFSMIGDDGELYSVGGSILSLQVEELDLISMNWTKGKGDAYQLSNSLYKIGKYPGVQYEKKVSNPKGTLSIIENEHSVIVQCGPEFMLECKEDHTWHLMIDSLDGEYKADLFHKPEGFPLWYGREKPSYLTQHSITYGYNWAGNSEGTLWIKGKKMKVKGQGIRERYVAVDSCAAELGGWEDWGWFTFQEVHSSMYDMRLGKKDFSIYDLEKKKHYPEGILNIEHEDWAFLRELEGFIPTTYKVKIEIEDGIYEIKAHVGNATTWGVTHNVPDYPVATLTFDTVEGKFTAKDGTLRVLTGGMGNMSIRQWHAYPSILPKELYSDERIIKERFSTL